MAHTIIGGLTGGTSGALGAAAGTLTAPAVANALHEAGIDGPLANTLTALTSTITGAVVGGFDGVSTAEVQSYFLQLTGKTELPQAIVTSKGARYTVTTEQGSFTLRDFASSTDKSGPVWTIEIPKSLVPSSPASGNTIEIKFANP